MNFVIDQGNTFLKLAVFEGDRLVEFMSGEIFNEELIDKINSKFLIKNSLFSSVDDKIPIELLKKHNFLILSDQTDVPLVVNYKTPKTLGIDRVAAAIGAKKTFSDANLLVIDMGTCITIDFINDLGEYFGGSISPGVRMRLKALHHFTGKLPLLSMDKGKVRLQGNTTDTSILSGVYHGVKYEIEGFIRNYQEQYSDLKVVVTGGDANLLDLEPKNRIFADNFLVLKGLNEILNYNERN